MLLFFLSVIHKVSWSYYYSFLAVGVSFLCLLSFYSNNLYRSWRGIDIFWEFLVITKSWVIVVGFILFSFFLFKISDTYSRAVVLPWLLLSPLVIFVFHCLIRYIARFIRVKGKNQKKAIIVGANDLGRKLRGYIESIPWAGIEVMGFFDDVRHDNNHSEANKQILGNLSEIKDYLTRNTIDYVYITIPIREDLKILNILGECRTLGSQIFLVPDFYVFGLLNAEFVSLGDMLVINFNPSKRWKRLFDVAFSILVILFWFPFFLLIAFLIKANDGGPIFYKHKRIMMAGKEFKCLKFRTMHVDADKRLSILLNNNPLMKQEWKATFKLKKDPRVTNIGKLLRKTSLDELPQFINVLKGEMSVVGARPIISKELYDYYQNSAGLYCSIKPGITGPWQIGKRSDTENYEERVQLDSWYVLNYSFLTDLLIIAKTFYSIIKGKGAY